MQRSADRSHAVLTRAQLSEVFCSAGSLSRQFHHYATFKLPSYGDVEKDLHGHYSSRTEGRGKSRANAYLKLPTVSDDHGTTSATTLRTHSLHGSHDFHAFHDFPEHHVLSVQMRRGHGGNEELGSIGVLPSISHGQQAGLSVALDEVLICELISVDALAASSVSSSEIASLAHEVGNDAVEAAAAVVQRSAGLAHAVLTRAQLSEVIRSAGSLGVQLEHDPPCRSASDGDVEEHTCGHY